MSLHWLFPFFSSHRDEIKISLILQFFILLLCSIVLDGGYLGRIMMFPAIAYWLATALIMLRRGTRTTVTDRILLRWGFPLFIALGIVLLALVSAFPRQ